MKTHLKEFDNLLEFQEWVNEGMDNLSHLNSGFSYHFTEDTTDSIIQRRGDKWYGEGIRYKDLAAGITEYRNKDLIEKLLDEVNNSVSLQTRDTIKARKVRYNAYGLGVFTFDRAAMGMYRLEEFYSPSKNQVVDRELVNFDSNPISLKSDQSTVIKRWEEKEDGKPKVRTTNKTVYAYYPQVKKEGRAVDLFVCPGGSSSRTAQQLLCSGISAIIVAQILERARIKTRITLLLGVSQEKNMKNIFGGLIRLKNYDENLDLNLIALLASDPAFFRWDGFRGFVALYDHFKKTCPSYFGYPLNRETMQKTIEQSDFVKNGKVSENRFYFGDTFTESDAKNLIEQTLTELAERLNGKQ